MEVLNNSATTRLPHQVIVKAPGLLPMLYKVSEISAELGVPESTLRYWLSKGAPSQKDAGGHLWINGEIFAGWVTAQKKQRSSPALSDGEAFCFHCKRTVSLLDIKIVPIKGKLIHRRGTCDACGSTIVRGGRLDPSS